MNRKKILLFLIIFLLPGANLILSGERILKKFRFLPQWCPQAQFAGYYVAYELGLYEKYGLEVTIITGGPDHPVCEYLVEGKADFVTDWLSGGIQNRANGIELVNIAQMSQKSALILVAKKSSGILSERDLDGKKVGLWGGDFQLLPYAFFQKYHIEVEIVPLQNTVNLFLCGGIDAMSAMWYNEFHTILSCGLNQDELTTFFFKNYEDLNFPEEGIYCLEETLNGNRSYCEAFVKASIEGWLYAFDHPDEALEMVIEYMTRAHLPANETHQRWMLARMKDLFSIVEPDYPIGRLDEGAYRMVASKLKNCGLIHEIPNFRDFYRECISHN